MDEVTDSSTAPSWSDVRKFQHNQIQLPMSTASTHRISNDLLGVKYGILENLQPESLQVEFIPKHNLRMECTASSSRQTENYGPPQPLCQDVTGVSLDTIQSLPEGVPFEIPKLEHLQSFESRGSERVQYQDTIHTYPSTMMLPTVCNALSSSISSGVFNANPSHILAATPYFANGPFINEMCQAHNDPLGRSMHLSGQASGRHIKSSSPQSYPHSPASAPGPAKPRTRARRGQATDPHSIAERKRREKITNAMKDLQDLVPTLNKADRNAFVEDVIDYVKFLQMQTKVFIMSRLGNPGAALVAEPSEQEGPQVATPDLHDCNLASLEEDIARLLEEDMGEALRLLQSKGLCLMPLSLAAVMPIRDTKQPSGNTDSIT